MDPLLLLLLALIIVPGAILGLKQHAFIALILGALIIGALTPASSLVEFALSQDMSLEAAQAFSERTVGTRLAEGFSNTARNIGILIAMAAIIGVCLLESGSAERIIRSTLKLFGEKRASAAFLTGGFTLSIPVFFDTVFYLLIPLAKTLGARTGRNYALLVLVIVAGGTMAHSLVPPTPGPLFVAAELGVNIGAMILAGLIVGSVSSLAGYGYAHWANRRWPIPVRSTPDASVEEINRIAEKPESSLPPFSIAILPILLPLILVSGKTIVGALGNPADGGLFAQLINQLGEPNIALTISAIIALIILARQKQENKQPISAFVGAALSSGGVIILITSAGGAFGSILQQAGIGLRIQDLAAHYELAVLPLAFFVTMLVRIAQGSATVAMITAVGIVGGFATSGAIDFHPVYLAMAIGCGSKPFPWMNDSGFWVICRMSGFTEAETLKTSSVLISLMGFVGLGATMILAALFPFA